MGKIPKKRKFTQLSLFDEQEILSITKQSEEEIEEVEVIDLPNGNTFIGLNTNDIY